MATVTEQRRGGKSVTGVGKSLTSVVIIGRPSLQNSLVAGLIDERLGFTCRVRAISSSDAEPVLGTAVALVDVEGMSLHEVQTNARTLCASDPHPSIAVMNAEPWTVEELAYLPGVRGVFLRNTSREHLLKGLRAIMAGEYWLPRHLLAAHFERTRPHAASAAQDIRLTSKEIETLRLLSGGCSNGDIARRLRVSAHTVKTHVYNLSRKLGVHNRVQAAKWAMENLGEPAALPRYGGGLEGARPADGGE